MSTAESLKQKLEQRKKETQQIEQVYREFAEDDLQKDRVIQEKGSRLSYKILNGLSAKSNNKHILSNAMPAKEYAVMREAAVASAQEAGLENLSKYGIPSPNSAVLPRPIPLHLPLDIGLLFPNLPDVLNAPYDITVDTACGLINLSSAGRRLVRSKTLKSLIQKRHPETGTTTNTDATGGGDDSSNELDLSGLTAQERIQKLVTQQVADVVISQPVDSSLPQSTLARLHADLDSALIKPGPADTTSFRDFHTLQIAFENVWMESLAARPWQLIAAFYRSVKTNDYSDSRDVIALEEASSLEEFWDAGRNLAALESDLLGARYSNPSDNLLYLVPDIEETWKRIGLAERVFLEQLANDKYPISLGGNVFVYLDPSEFHDFGRRTINGISDENRQRDINARSEHISSVISSLDLSSEEPSRLKRLLDEIATSLGENYKFQHFAPNSINFGVVSTYRHTMEPGSYTAGDLKKTVPLAPGETRSFEITQTQKTSVARKEIEKYASSNSHESSVTNRLDTEIIDRAEEATNFSTTTAGHFEFGIGTIDNTTAFQLDQKRHSQETKKTFREAVLKAAQEVKSERNLEVNISNDFEFSATQKGELKNPNNELTVTYLLYELEREYKVSEKIHALTPVIMVAQELPEPDDITEAWLLRHDWVLKRVLLDKQFLSPINMLRDDFVSDEVAINIKKANWQTQLSIVEELQGETSSLLAEKRKINDQLITAEYDQAVADANSNRGGFLHKLTSAIITTPFLIRKNRQPKYIP